MRHEVTEVELSEYVEAQRRAWSRFATSSGIDHEVKRLEFSIGLTTPMYRVTSGSRTIYIGSLKETAVREYNALP